MGDFLFVEVSYCEFHWPHLLVSLTCQFHCGQNLTWSPDSEDGQRADDERHVCAGDWSPALPNRCLPWEPPWSYHELAEQFVIAQASKHCCLQISSWLRNFSHYLHLMYETTKRGNTETHKERQTDRHWDRQADQHWIGRSIRRAEELVYSCRIWPKMAKLMDFLLFLFILHWCPLSSLEIYYSGSFLFISSLLCSPRWGFFLFSVVTWLSCVPVIPCYALVV